MISWTRGDSDPPVAAIRGEKAERKMSMDIMDTGQLAVPRLLSFDQSSEGPCHGSRLKRVLREYTLLGGQVDS